MQIENKDIKHALDTSQNFRETYFTYFHNDKPYISVNDLLKIVSTTLGKKVIVSFHDDDFKDHSMYSFVHIEEDGSYEICLMSGMTNCWNRFALCKELFHVILDSEDVRNTSIKSHLYDFKSSVTDGTIEGNQSSKYEMLAEFAAMQFLLPYQRRLEYFKKINVADNRKPIYEQIAIDHRLPRLMVEDYVVEYMIALFDPISWIERSDRR